MKKERQIGIRVGVPAFFALELEDMYRHRGRAPRPENKPWKTAHKNNYVTHTAGAFWP
jgi:hypothetical protein